MRFISLISLSAIAKKVLQQFFLSVCVSLSVCKGVCVFECVSGSSFRFSLAGVAARRINKQINKANNGWKIDAFYVTAIDTL